MNEAACYHNLQFSRHPSLSLDRCHLGTSGIVYLSNLPDPSLQSEITNIVLCKAGENSSSDAGGGQLPATVLKEDRKRGQPRV